MRKQLIAALLATVAGCGGFVRGQASSTTLEILTKSSAVARRQADPQLAREALPGGIIQLAAFAAAYPDERAFRVLHASALCDYMAGFVFDDWEEAALDLRDEDASVIAERLELLLEGCVAANVALLPTNVLEDPKLAQKDHEPQLLAVARAGVIALALAPLANIAKLPLIRRQLARCAELAPGAHDGEADVLLGMIAAQLGDDAKPYFDRARKGAGPQALIVEVMFARGVLVPARDLEAFETALQRVLATDHKQWPEHRLANELARKKARRYLRVGSNLFRR